MKIIFLSLGLFTLLLSTQIAASACSCPDDSGTTLEQKVKVNLEKSKAAFSGEVIKIDRISEFTISVTIKVNESWKGVVPEKINITTDFPDGAGCGYNFQVGKTYLIFARVSKENKLFTGLCVGNSPLETAVEELKILGKGAKPEREAETEDRSQRSGVRRKQ